jgi:hypothetical protein
MAVIFFMTAAPRPGSQLRPSSESRVAKAIEPEIAVA